MQGRQPPLRNRLNHTWLPYGDLGVSWDDIGMTVAARRSDSASARVLTMPEDELAGRQARLQWVRGLMTHDGVLSYALFLAAAYHRAEPLTWLQAQCAVAKVSFWPRAFRRSWVAGPSSTAEASTATSLLGTCQTAACTRHEAQQREHQREPEFTSKRLLPSSGQPTESQCQLTSWGQDGFGHQLMAIMSCEAYAMKNASYEYVSSNHTALEHSPPDVKGLLRFLNRWHGAGANDEPSRQVRSGIRYHGNCPAERPPPCHPGRLTICDNCFSHIQLRRDARGRAIQQELAERLRKSVAKAVAGGGSCARRSDVCVHFRGVGSPGEKKAGLMVTSMAAERSDVWRRMRARPSPWYLQAIDEATKIAVRSGNAATAHSRVGGALKVTVHTNHLEWAHDIFLAEAMKTNRTLSGKPIELIIADVNTSLLSMLHELLFCCDTFIDGDSALSSLAALGTLAKSVISSKPWNDELGFAYDRVIGAWCAPTKKSAARQMVKSAQCARESSDGITEESPQTGSLPPTS